MTLQAIVDQGGARNLGRKSKSAVVGSRWNDVKNGVARPIVAGFHCLSAIHRQIPLV
jgi:hypothetical protein